MNKKNCLYDVSVEVFGVMERNKGTASLRYNNY